MLINCCSVTPWGLTLLSVIRSYLHMSHCSGISTMDRRLFPMVLIPWRRKWRPTPVFLPGELHGQMGSQRVGHDCAEGLMFHTLIFSTPQPPRNSLTFVHLLVAFGHTSRSGIARILNIISTKFKVLRVSKTPIFNLEIRITKILPCLISVKLKRGNICKGLLLLIICFKMPNEAQM